MVTAYLSALDVQVPISVGAEHREPAVSLGIKRPSSILMVTTMGIEPTNYRCDADCARLPIQLVYSVSNQSNVYSLALTFHVVFVVTILKYTYANENSILLIPTVG